MTAKYLLQKHVGMYCFHLTQCVDCRCGPLQRTHDAKVTVEFRVKANGHRYACDCSCAMVGGDRDGGVTYTRNNRTEGGGYL